MSRTSRRRAAAVATLVSATLLALPTTATAAASPGDGRWYIDAMKLPAVHQVARGEGVQIAVIDTAVNPAAPDLVGTDLEVREPSFCDPVDGVELPAAHTGPQAGHGTAMVALILGTDAGANGQPGIRGVAPGATVRFYSTNAQTQPDGADCAGAGEDQALEEAIDDGADIVSMSFDSASLMQDAVARAQREGIILVAAAGNRPGPFSLPAGMNGVLAVAGAGEDGTLLPSPSGPRMGLVAPGGPIRVYDFTTWEYAVASGSSTATAITSGALAVAWSRWPDATANQILQSVLRNTGSEPHELEHTDEYGYGFLNLSRIVETDPTQYEDVNPLLAEDTELGPPASDVLGDATAEPAPEDSGTGDVPPVDDETSTGLPLLGLVAIGALAMLVVAGVVIAIVLGARRRGAGTTVPAPPAPGHPTFDAANRGDHHG